MKKEEESTVQMEWLTSIDSTTLTHSELQALSLSSLSSFDLKSTRVIVTPKIDPSTFNHSAGSHRTYSRPHRRCRVPPLLPTPTLPSDHRIIINQLKQFIREDPKVKAHLEEEIVNKNGVVIAPNSINPFIALTWYKSIFGTKLLHVKICVRWNVCYNQCW